jgi:hypothetical protein
MIEHPAEENARSAIEIFAQLLPDPNRTAPNLPRRYEHTLAFLKDSNQRIVPVQLRSGTTVA